MRLALGIEYDGTDFCGWQRLSHERSVQAEVEAALTFVAAHPVEVTCAGRTDAGVHARCQVVHFDSDATRSERAWVLGANSRLARDVAVLWARPVADGFHARFGARARRYRYTILNRPVRAALAARFVTWERVPLDVEAMQRAAQALVGEHDFSAFRAIACQAHSARRDLREIAVARCEQRREAAAPEPVRLGEQAIQETRCFLESLRQLVEENEKAFVAWDEAHGVSSEVAKATRRPLNWRGAGFVTQPRQT